MPEISQQCRRKALQKRLPSLKKQDKLANLQVQDMAILLPLLRGLKNGSGIFLFVFDTRGLEVVRVFVSGVPE